MSAGYHGPRESPRRCPECGAPLATDGRLYWCRDATCLSDDEFTETRLDQYQPGAVPQPPAADPPEG